MPLPLLRRWWLLLILLGGCTFEPVADAPLCPAGQPCPYRTYSTTQLLYPEEPSYGASIDIPIEARQRNWGRGGSCYVAAIVNALRWCGYEELADYFRDHYSGGQYTKDIAAKLDKHGVQFAVCYDGDPEFLDWAIRTRRIVAITYYKRHAINLVDLDQETATLLDNNRPKEYIRVPRDDFLWRWKNYYGGGAVVVVGPPAPPVPGAGPIPAPPVPST